MEPLFNLILTAVKPPQDDIEQTISFQAVSIDYDQFVGRQATGRVLLDAFPKAKE